MDEEYLGDGVSYQEGADSTSIACRKLIMAIQSPIDLPPQLDLDGREGHSPGQNGRIHIETHVQSKTIGHALMKPTCCIRTRCLERIKSAIGTHETRIL